MKYIKYLTYFNLICGIIVLWTYLRSLPLYFDYYLIIGFALTIWYNWETLKQLKGLKNRLNRVNYLIGILTVLFGILLVVDAAGMINDGLSEVSNKVQLSVGAFYAPFGLTTIFLALTTIKYFKTAQN